MDFEIPRVRVKLNSPLTNVGGSYYRFVTMGLQPPDIAA